MKHFFKYSIACCVLLVITAFDQVVTPEEQETIDRGVEIRIEEFIKAQRNHCKAKAITIAEQRVDSLVRALARENAVFTVDKPLRPGKPEMPPVRTLPDSLSHELLKAKKGN